MRFRLLFYILLLALWIGPASRAGMLQLPKTGQVKIFAPGDDGALQKGIAVPSPRFSDNNDGTVTDALTGLIWLKNGNCFGTQTWEEALVSANNLQSGACGLNDGSTAGTWRLPNVNELQTLMDLANNNPSLQTGHPFIDVQNASYWTSTTDSSLPSQAFYISTGAGYTNTLSKFERFYAWPVRGGRTSLGISKSGSGTGSIFPSSGNIDWSGVFGSADYDLGTSVTLSATAADGSVFSGWSGCAVSNGDNCSVTLDQAKHVLATFNLLPPSISGMPASSATVGTPYSFMPTSSNATSFGLNGTIPPGMTFDVTSGMLSGTPISAGLYSNIVISAINASGTAQLPPFSITVYQPPPSISGTPSANALLGTSYSFIPTANNATSFSYTGNLPPGLYFNTATGALSGIPTATGIYSNIVIAAINATGSTFLPAFTITVNPPPPTISGSPTSIVTIGSTYGFTPTATYATSFSILNKPVWATFNTSTGTLTGTPSSAGTYSNITIIAENSTATAVLSPFSIVVNPPVPTNTVPSGTNILTVPAPSVAVTFNSVNTQGTISATLLESPSAIENFRILETSSYQIVTTASFSGPVTVCLDYNNAALAVPENEPNLRLFHYNGQMWEDITTSIDTVNKKIYGVTYSLSPFAVAEPVSHGASSTQVPVMDGWWLMPSLLAGLGIMIRRTKK